MSQGKSTQSSTQTRNVAPMSASESLLQEANTKSAQAQAQALRDAIAKQSEYENSQGYKGMLDLGNQAQQGYGALMQNGFMPTGQQQAALQQYYQSIMNPQMEAMRRDAAATAAMRGQTLADTPVGGDYARQLANYQAQMGGQQAGAGLQLGQQTGQQYQNVMSLGQQLAQNAAQNRLALTNAHPGSYDFGNMLAQNRINSAPITQTVSGTQSQPFAQSMAYGLQGLNSGMGAAQTGLNLYTGGGTNKITGRGYGLMDLFSGGGQKPPTPVGYAPQPQPYSLGANTRLTSPWDS